MHTPLRPGLGPGLALLAGLAAAAGQVPWSLWPLALAGYALGLWLVATAPGVRAAAGRAWLFGCGHFLLALHWITEPFQVDAARDGWMAPFALVLMAAGLALFWALAGAVSARAPRRVLGFALALAAAEWARGRVLSGFPWAQPGHIWLGHAPEQLAAWGGAEALMLLTLAAAALPVAARWRGAGLAAVLLAAAFGLGAWQARQPVPPAPGPVIRLVQPDADQMLKWQPEWAGAFFARHLDLTAAPAARRPDLIVWPETAVPFLLNEPWDGLERMVAAADGVPIVFGVQRTEGLRGYNSLAVLDRGADGAPALRAVYDKHHLVPFGEYIPGGDLLVDWLSIPSFAPKEGYGYSAGPGPALLDLGPLGRVLPLICYEAVFAWFPRAVARPDWMLQITNDAWFGDVSGPYQHLALNRLRTIETGLPLVRVANTGVSAVVDARGRVVAELGLNRMGTLDVALPGALPPTPYARWGDWPAAVVWLLGLGLLLRRRALRH
ncbi:MAG: apolipoprotein N-acyltransferase [Gemmobacter sp.]|uniref:apolipoprotein N-acyltransferase n=1 Tax=Gemmobacter sp. TaxID=1898957 RepID=UPI0039190DF2